MIQSGGPKGPNESTAASTVWRQLVSVAILGTERQALPIPFGDEDLGALTASLQEEDREKTLLSAGAAVAAYLRAGKRPLSLSHPAETPSEREDLPRVGARAGQRLALILSGMHKDVLPEWLELVSAAGRRVPEEFLPALLTLVRLNPAHRNRLIAVLGKRGEWLAAQNPDWELSGRLEDDSIWQTGARAARLAWLQQVRNRDAARARIQLESTWSEESVEDRLVFLTALRAGLSIEDETFLESALDDRRKEVRRAAADLLCRLNGSRLCARMVDRLRPLVRLEDRPASRMLGLVRGSKPTIEVDLPNECSKEMMRDGIEQTAPQKVGQRAWWLIQMLGVVPPSLWVETWQKTPAEIISIAAASEWQEVLLQGCERAAINHGDSGWADALISNLATRPESLPRLSSLFSVVEQERKNALAMELLSLSREPFSARHPAFWILKEWQGPWGVDLTRRLLDLLRRRVASSEPVDYALRSSLAGFALNMPTGLADEAMVGWARDSNRWNEWSQAVSQMNATLHFRREMQKEIGE
jgi:hypothetical protein